jgi:spore coat protein JC
MWLYEKRLEYPVRVSKHDPQMAKYLYTQLGGLNLLLFIIKIG